MFFKVNKLIYFVVGIKTPPSKIIKPLQIYKKRGHCGRYIQATKGVQSMVASKRRAWGIPLVYLQRNSSRETLSQRHHQDLLSLP